MPEKTLKKKNIPERHRYPIHILSYLSTKLGYLGYSRVSQVVLQEAECHFLMLR